MINFYFSTVTVFNVFRYNLTNRNIYSNILSTSCQSLLLSLRLVVIIVSSLLSVTIMNANITYPTNPPQSFTTTLSKPGHDSSALELVQKIHIFLCSESNHTSIGRCYYVHLGSIEHETSNFTRLRHYLV